MKTWYLTPLIFTVIGTYVGISFLATPGKWYVAAIASIAFILAFLDLWRRARRVVGTRDPLLLALENMGVIGIHTSVPHPDPMPSRIQKAKFIRIMQPSGKILLQNQDKMIIDALKEGAKIHWMITEDKSEVCRDFVQVERLANNLCTWTDTEIRDVEEKLYTLLHRAWDECEPSKRRAIGKIFVGYYRTHLRCQLVLCDRDWGWMSITLPPARPRDSWSFELRPVKGGLLEQCDKHFDYSWQALGDGLVNIDLSREVRQQPRIKELVRT